MKIILRLLALAIALVPFSILAFKGVNYLVHCFWYASAPGENLTFPIVTEQGDLLLKVGSYSFDPLMGIANAQHIEILDPLNRPMASAKSLHVRAPHLLRWPNTRLSVEVRGLSGTLERGEDGKFTFEKYFPPQPKGEPGPPVEVRILNAEIGFVDRSTSPDFSQRFVIPSVSVFTAKDDMVATGVLKLLGKGEIRFRANKRADNSVSVVGKAGNVELAEIFRSYHKDFDPNPKSEVHQLTARTIRLSGPFSAEIMIGKAPDFEFNGEATVRDLASPWWTNPVSGTVRGRITEMDWSGSADAYDSVSTAQLKGSARWDRGFQLSGQVDAKTPRLWAIPKKYLAGVPNELNATNITFSGPLSINEKGEVKLGGTVRSPRVAYAKQILDSVEAEVRMDKDDLTAFVNRATWRLSPISGSLAFNAKTKDLKGFVSAKGVSLGQLRNPDLDRILRARGDVEVTLSGTAEKLETRGTLRGKGATYIEDRWVELGQIEAAGKLTDQVLQIDRANIRGETGTALAKGSYHLTKNHLDVQLTAYGVNLSRFREGLTGMANAKIAVRGTLENPLATGRVEAYGSEYEGQSLPLVAADIRANEKKLTLTRLAASRGASRLDGIAELEFKTGKLSGSLESAGIQLSDWIAKDVTGSVAIEKATLGGTLEHPEIDATLRGSIVVVKDVRIDRARLQARFGNNMVTVRQAILGIGTGEAEFNGNYDLQQKKGVVSGKVSSAPLDAFVPLLPGEVLLDGKLSGDLVAQVDDGKASKIEMDGQVRDFSVNRTSFGSGFFTARSQGNDFSGQFEIGQPDRYIQVSDAKYNTESKALQGKIVAAEMPFSDLYQAARPSVEKQGENTKEQKGNSLDSLLSFLDRVKGDVNADVQLGGSVDELSIQANLLSLTKATVSNEKSGDLIAAFTRGPRGLWDIQSFRWENGPGQAKASGMIDEHGDVKVEGSLENFHPRYLSLFSDKFSKLTGNANLAFEASGPVKQPLIFATIDANLIEVPAEAPGDSPTYALNFASDPIRIQEGKIEVSGRLNYKGLTGNVTGEIPFAYPFVIPEDQSLELSVNLPERPLSEVEKVMPAKFEGEWNGMMSARLSVTGNANRLSLGGNVKVFAENIKLSSSSAELRNVNVNGTFADQVVSVAASAESGKSGKATANLRVKLPDLLTDFDGDVEKLLGSPIEGLIKARGIEVNERFGLNKTGAVDVAADGELRITGPMRSPLISTTFPVAVSRLNLFMPSEFEETKPGPEPKFRPRFSIALAVAREKAPAKIRAASTSIDLYGSAALTGDLVSPVLTSSLLVRDGSIRLPNARIGLEEGGSVRVNYRASDLEQPLRVDVNLEGKTALSTTSLGGLVKRYDINLQIRGNLLREDQLLFTARSDPPELTQARILNLLGQESIVESLVGQISGNRNDRVLAGALTSLAIPVLFDPLTERLARELGLEYLTLEYNALEGATVTGAKNLGKGFMLQGRRQLNETLQNKLLYDYRLTYRPTLGGKTLRSIIFSIGSDQDRPYKIAIDYTIRF